ARGRGARRATRRADHAPARSRPADRGVAQVTAQPPATGLAWPPPPRPPASAPARTDLDAAEFRAAVRQIFPDLAEGLAEVTSRAGAQPVVEKAVQDWVVQHARRAWVPPETQARLAQAVLDERFGLGPLQPYVSDPDVENIDINGAGEVWLRLNDGQKVRAGPVAVNDEELIEMV